MDAGRGQNTAGGRRTWDFSSLLLAFLTGALMAAAWGILSTSLGLEKLFPSQAQEEMLSRSLPVQLALYGVVSPVGEEILFRWLLYGLLGRFLPCRAAAVATAALFALWHGNVLQMLYAFPAGLLLQALRIRSGGLLEPVSCHVGANLTAILVTAIAGRISI